MPVIKHLTAIATPMDDPATSPWLTCGRQRHKTNKHSPATPAVPVGGTRCIADFLPRIGSLCRQGRNALRCRGAGHFGRPSAMPKLAQVAVEQDWYEEYLCPSSAEAGGRWTGGHCPHQQVLQPPYGVDSGRPITCMRRNSRARVDSASVMVNTSTLLLCRWLRVPDSVPRSASAPTSSMRPAARKA